MIKLRLIWNIIRGRPVLYKMSLILAKPIEVEPHTMIVGNYFKLEVTNEHKRHNKKP